MKSQINTKKLTTLALLSAIGYLTMFLIKIPVVSFLKYEPKDIFIVLAGFLYGPLSAAMVSVVTALLELPISSTGVIGMVMNILSSAAFACPAALIYHKRKDTIGAALGLLSGLAAMTLTMLLWNYLISPLYMDVSREAIVPMLTSIFLPFNLLKAGLNASAAMLLYRPFVRVLRQCGLVHDDTHTEQTKSARVLTAVLSVAILLGCAAIVVLMNRQ